MTSIQYIFKGQKHNLDISASTTLPTFLEAISEQTQVPVSGLKVMLKGKVLRPEEDEAEETRTLLEQHPILATGAKIFVLGTTEEDLAKIHSIDKHVHTKRSYRPPPAAKFSQQDKARAVLERLKQDRGIVEIMKLHKLRVGSLIELSPADKTLLGYNRNKGELIALKLRTDDLEGFRHYDAVRKVLLHELVHNVWIGHDDNFHALNRQLNKEVQQLDWTAQDGHTVSKDAFFDPANGLTGYHDDLESHERETQCWQGGTFVLGGSTSRRNGDSTLSTRELVARAAQLRQIESEKDEDGMCGAPN
ncbi:hypothetical protein BGZ65_010910 [Modicella reniformis]|uniref:WLM domain-containing protein n=1 Tax=Modicella reniformis TaxID=1440133 RepID=A0A9P6SPJ2_9FUNG|nr:hypothetical protein BGZ65_010910 [Modicella reniformis]